MEEIDCRGLTCPAPVVAVKNALDRAKGGSFLIRLDNGAARENVLRFCKSKGCAVIEDMNDDSTSLIISSNLQVSFNDELSHKLLSPVVLIASDRLGNGPDELGKLLLKNFIITLLELQQQPAKIIFVNSGVLLTSEGSELIEPLDRLASSGVEILSCGVCLDYYVIREKLAVGTITNMFSIAESMLLTANTIRL